MKNELLKSLKIVLDYVERWNKQDADKEVAQAAQKLTELFEEKCDFCEDEAVRTVTADDERKRLCENCADKFLP